MSANALHQQHSDNVLRAVERQRNDALTREAQKDALIALLQGQGASLMEKLKAAETRIAELETRIAEMETAAQRKKPKAA